MKVFPAVEVKYDENKNIIGLDITSRYKEEFYKAIKANNSAGFVSVTIDKPIKPATLEQNKTFHALLSCYWSSGCCNEVDYDVMRDKMKMCRGLQAVKSVIALYFVNNIIIQKHFKRIDDIEPNAVGIVYIAKSWTDMNRKERSKAIDFLISEMMQTDVHLSKSATAFNKIMEGINAK
ncbi:MAG: hypothetical protein OEV44_01285 [Spirochaetota bacterium]|nr:hypothetical protein [Spirochaetota bacterium]